MKNTGRQRRTALVGSALLASLVLTGCGFSDVEFNGALFEYAGLTNNSKSKEEPKLPPRPGVVLPPQLDRLPEPGAADVANAPGGEAWPVDPEESKVAAVERLDKEHEAYCRDALWRARAQGQNEAHVRGPKGSCSPSILRNLTGKDVTTR